jgi:ABC-type uncharacterized transport system ATPase component
MIKCGIILNVTKYETVMVTHKCGISDKYGISEVWLNAEKIIYDQILNNFGKK